MSNIAMCVKLFQKMEDAHQHDVEAAKAGVNEMKQVEGQSDGEFAAAKEKQMAQVDMMDFQGRMQLEQQLISAMSTVISKEGQTGDKIIGNF